MAGVHTTLLLATLGGEGGEAGGELFAGGRAAIDQKPVAEEAFAVSQGATSRPGRRRSG